jgi:hypothetical protein
MNLVACSNTIAGQFTCWSNGFVDFDIFDTVSGEFVANKWMIAVDDENLESVYRDFVEELRKHRSIGA